MPNLDDRRYQDLVDDAKRHVQRRCPTWTSHNVSDPGVTLIETFAYMVDQVLYRLNRVPDRLFVKFLDLVGVRLLPGRAATAQLTFWLSTPAARPLDIAAGTEAATPRTVARESTSFRTVAPVVIVPCTFRSIPPLGAAGDPTAEVRTEINAAAPVQCFSTVPQPGEALAIGLSNAVPSCAVLLHVEAPIGGIGIEPEDPPIVWEAWTTDGWVTCDVDRGRSDDIWGLNREGNLVLHVPPGHVESTIGGTEAGWLRCRVLPARPGQASYTASPQISGVTASTVGGTTEAVHSERVEHETLGVSDGNAGQEFTLARGPVVRDATPLVLDVLRPVKGSEDAVGAPATDVPEAVWEEWTEVDTFVDSSPSDRHFVLDAAAGTISFGPVVRLANGGLRRYGGRPAYGAMVQIRSYQVGGGQRGNVDAGSINQLKSSIPTVGGVENRRPAHGGADPETIDEAKLRGPLTLHARDRAVTREDFETIARSTTSRLARVRCVEVDADEAGGSPGARVLVVPKPPHDRPRVTVEDLAVEGDVLEQVRSALDRRRVIGTRVVVQPASYQPVIVLARITPRLRADRAELERDALDALHAFFNPLTGGSDGVGWPFGLPASAGDAYAVLQQLPNVRVVEEVRLIALDPQTGQPAEHTQRVDIDRNALIVSGEHQIKLEDE